jgi:hypothetical protein
MAIRKRAKSSILRVNTKHVVMAGKIEKTAERIKLVATCGNIELYSINKIIKNGNIN